MAEKTTWLDAIPQDAREELMHDISASQPYDLVPLQINNKCILDSFRSESINKGFRR